ncbi:MAG: hypothetical protein JWQ71_2678 [Pedosphaera sp.]|nr:hypothetical protein [Pedosphaera sp.]
MHVQVGGDRPWQVAVFVVHAVQPSEVINGEEIAVGDGGLVGVGAAGDVAQ